MNGEERRELYAHATTLFVRVDALDEWLHRHHLRRLARPTTGAWMIRRIKRKTAERVASAQAHGLLWNAPERASL